MYLKYLRYMIAHKWFVFVEACKLGIPWLGFLHDWSKFLPDEWRPYTKYFYGNYPDWHRFAPGTKGRLFGLTKQEVQDKFDLAWLKHIHRNRHHWQWWVLREDDGDIKVLPMPDRYRKEMLADWRGAGKAQGYEDNTKTWYQANKDKMQLHPDTRIWIEEKIGIGHKTAVRGARRS